MTTPGRREPRDPDFARDEVGGSMVETALIFSLAATFAIVMRSAVGMPLLQRFVDAAKTLENVLG